MAAPAAAGTRAAELGGSGAAAQEGSAAPRATQARRRGHPFIRSEAMRSLRKRALKEAQKGMLPPEQQEPEDVQEAQPDDSNDLERLQAKLSASLRAFVEGRGATPEEQQEMRERAERQRDWEREDDSLLDVRSLRPKKRNLNAEREQAQRILETVVQGSALSLAFGSFEEAIEAFKRTGEFELPPTLQELAGLPPPDPEEVKKGAKELDDVIRSKKLEELIPQFGKLPRGERLAKELLAYIRKKYRILIRTLPSADLAPFAERLLEESMDAEIDEAVLVLYGPRGLAEWRLFTDPIAVLRSIPDLRIGPSILLFELERRLEGKETPAMPPALAKFIDEKTKEDAEEAAAKAKAQAEEAQKKKAAAEEAVRAERKAELEAAVREARNMDPEPTLMETPTNITEWRRIARVRRERRRQAVDLIAALLRKTQAADEALLQRKAREQGWTLSSADPFVPPARSEPEHHDSAVRIVERSLLKLLGEHEAAVFGIYPEPEPEPATDASKQAADKEGGEKGARGEAKAPEAEEEAEKRKRAAAQWEEAIRAYKEDAAVEELLQGPDVVPPCDGFELLSRLLGSDDERLIALGVELVEAAGGVRQFGDLLRDAKDASSVAFRRHYESLVSRAKEYAAKKAAAAGDEKEQTQAAKAQRMRAESDALRRAGGADAARNEAATDEAGTKADAEAAGKAGEADFIDRPAELRRAARSFIDVAGAWHRFSVEAEKRAQARPKVDWFEQDVQDPYTPEEVQAKRKEVMARATELLTRYKEGEDPADLIAARNVMRELPRVDEADEMSRRMTALATGRLQPFSREATELEAYLHRRMRFYMRQMCKLLKQNYVDVVPDPPRLLVHPPRPLATAEMLTAPVPVPGRTPAALKKQQAALEQEAAEHEAFLRQDRAKLMRYVRRAQRAKAREPSAVSKAAKQARTKLRALLRLSSDESSSSSESDSSETDSDTDAAAGRVKLFNKLQAVVQRNKGLRGLPPNVLADLEQQCGGAVPDMLREPGAEGGVFEKDLRSLSRKVQRLLHGDSAGVPLSSSSSSASDLEAEPDPNDLDPAAQVAAEMRAHRNEFRTAGDDTPDTDDEPIPPQLLETSLMPLYLRQLRKKKPYDAAEEEANRKRRAERMTKEEAAKEAEREAAAAQAKAARRQAAAKRAEALAKRMAGTTTGEAAAGAEGADVGAASATLAADRHAALRAKRLAERAADAAAANADATTADAPEAPGAEDAQDDAAASPAVSDDEEISPADLLAEEGSDKEAKEETEEVPVDAESAAAAAVAAKEAAEAAAAKAEAATVKASAARAAATDMLGDMYWRERMEEAEAAAKKAPKRRNREQRARDVRRKLNEELEEALWELALLKENQRFVLSRLFAPHGLLIQQYLQAQDDSSDDEEEFRPAQWPRPRDDLAWLDEAEEDAAAAALTRRLQLPDEEVSEVLRERWAPEVHLALWFAPERKQKLDEQRAEQAEAEELLPRDVDLKEMIARLQKADDAMRPYRSKDIDGYLKEYEPEGAGEGEELSQLERELYAEYEKARQEAEAEEAAAANVPTATEQRAKEERERREYLEWKQRRLLLIIRRTAREVIEGRREGELRERIRFLIKEGRGRGVFPAEKCEFDPPVVTRSERRVLRVMTARGIERSFIGPDPDERDKPFQRWADLPTVKSLAEFRAQKFDVEMVAHLLYGVEKGSRVVMLMERRLRKIERIRAHRAEYDKEVASAVRRELMGRDPEMDMERLRKVAPRVFVEIEGRIGQLLLEERIARKGRRLVRLNELIACAGHGDPPGRGDVDKELLPAVAARLAERRAAREKKKKKEEEEKKTGKKKDKKQERLEEGDEPNWMKGAEEQEGAEEEEDDEVEEEAAKVKEAEPKKPRTSFREDLMDEERDPNKAKARRRELIRRAQLSPEERMREEMLEEAEKAVAEERAKAAAERKAAAAKTAEEAEAAEFDEKELEEEFREEFEREYGGVEDDVDDVPAPLLADAQDDASARAEKAAADARKAKRRARYLANQILRHLPPPTLASLEEGMVPSVLRMRRMLPAVMQLRLRLAAEFGRRRAQSGVSRRERIAQIRDEVNALLRDARSGRRVDETPRPPTMADEERETGQRWSAAERIAARGGPLLETEMRVAMAAAEAEQQRDLKGAAAQDPRRDPAFQSMLALSGRLEAAIANAKSAVVRADEADPAAADPYGAGQLAEDAWRGVLERSLAEKETPLPPPEDSPVIIPLPSVLRKPVTLKPKIKPAAKSAAKRGNTKKAKGEDGQETEAEEEDGKEKANGEAGKRADQAGAAPAKPAGKKRENTRLFGLGRAQKKKAARYPIILRKGPKPRPAYDTQAPPPPRGTGAPGGFPAAAPTREPRTPEERAAALAAQERRRVVRVPTVEQRMAEERHNYRRQLAVVRRLDAPRKFLRMAKLERELLKREAEDARSMGRDPLWRASVLVPDLAKDEEWRKRHAQEAEARRRQREELAERAKLLWKDDDEHAPAARLAAKELADAGGDPEEARRVREAWARIQRANAAFEALGAAPLPQAVLESPFVRQLREINDGTRGRTGGPAKRPRMTYEDSDTDLSSDEDIAPLPGVAAVPPNPPRPASRLALVGARCPVYWLGCPWRGKQEHLSAHLSSCELAAGLVMWYAAQPWHCPGSRNGCTWLGKRSQMGRHMRACEYVPPFTVKCPLCDFRAAPSEELDRHITSCNAKPKKEADLTELTESEMFNARRLLKEEERAGGDALRSRDDALRLQLVLLRYTHAHSACEFRPDENCTLEEHISECPYMHRRLRSSALPLYRDTAGQFNHCPGEVLGCPFISRDDVAVSSHVRRCKYAEKYVRGDAEEDADAEVRRMVLAQEDNSAEGNTPDGPIRCPARRYGCQWIGIAEEFRHHYETCRFVQRAIEAAVEHTLEEQFERVMAKEGWVHCLGEGYGCKWFGERHEAEFHVYGCSFVQRNKPCPAAEFGCEFRGTYDDIVEHFRHCQVYFKVQYGLKVFTLKRRYAGLAMINYIRNSKAGPPTWIRDSWVGRWANPTLLGMFFQPKFSMGEALYLLHAPANTIVVACVAFGWIGLLHWKAWYFGN